MGAVRWELKSYRAASHVEIPHISVCQGPGHGPVAPHRPQGPVDPQFAASQCAARNRLKVGWPRWGCCCVCGASGLPAGKKFIRPFRSVPGTRKNFNCLRRRNDDCQDHLTPNPTVPKFTDARGDARRTLAEFPFQQATKPNQQKPTKSCLSEVVEVVVTVVAVAASEVRFITLLSTVMLSCTLLSSISHLGRTLVSTMDATQEGDLLCLTTTTNTSSTMEQQ